MHSVQKDSIQKSKVAVLDVALILDPHLKALKNVYDIRLKNAACSNFQKKTVGIKFTQKHGKLNSWTTPK